MSYGWSKETKTDVQAGNFIPAGIQENVKVTEIFFEVNEKNQSNTLVVHFEDAYGRKHRETIFEAGDGEYKEHNEHKISLLIGNLTRVLMGDPVYAPDFGEREDVTFKELCHKVVKDIGDKFKNTEMRVKFVLNNKDFPTLSRHIPSIESMAVPLEQSKIRIMAQHPYNERIEPLKPTAQVEIEAPVQGAEDPF